MASTKRGYGNVSGVFSSTLRSVAVQLDATPGEKIITVIHAGYGVSDPALHAFEAGRLLIVRGAYEQLNKQGINPHSVDVPDDVPAVVYDMPFDARVKFIDFGPRGMSIPANVIYTVILVRPSTVGDVWPLADAMNGFLSVEGYELDGRDNPFGELR